MAITGAHGILYTDDAAGDRTFFADVLGLKSVDAGGGFHRATQLDLLLQQLIARRPVHRRLSRKCEVDGVLSSSSLTWRL